MGPSKTIFVANIPFDVTEEQLAHVFAEAGPVQGVEIKFDPTGKPKGYAFVQFYDEAAADSAVRNLRGRQIGDRQLRVELSNDQPGQSRGGAGGNNNMNRGGGQMGRGGPQMGGGGRRSPPPPAGGPGGSQFRPPPFGGPPGPGAGFGGPPPPSGPGAGGRVDLGMVPPGVDLPRGQNAMDHISRTLADVQPGQMQDVMAGMKTLISTSPDQARQLLSQKPQLAYALFQAMLLMNIVDPQVLEHVKPVPAAPAPAPSYPPSQNNYGGPPPPMPQQSYQPPAPARGYGAPPPATGDPRLNSYRPPPPGPPAPAPAGYGAPPPAQQGGLAPEVQAMLSTLPEDQRTTLMSVLQMTPDQINTLDPTQRQSVMQLRQQFLGA